jgi:imidazole glycerol-phosphate synthase subunit HisH
LKVAIIKYGMGNVTSVEKALKKIGVPSTITDNQDEIAEADFIILPGVGAFKKGMENLQTSGLADFLTEQVIEKKKPFIGICLGMQLVASDGNEPEPIKGLGWIDGDVIKIKSNLRVPHLGWNEVISKNENSLFHDFQKQDFYFIHSYHFKPQDPKYVMLSVEYDGEKVAAIHKNNIYAVQFHPEKSQDFGIALLKKILDQHA